MIYVKNFSLQEYPDEPAAIAQENSEENVPDEMEDVDAQNTKI